MNVKTKASAPSEQPSTKTVPSTELQTLKARADMMGIAYHPNIGVKSLKVKIDNRLEGKLPVTKGSPENEDVKPDVKGNSNNKEAKLKPAEKRTWLTHEEYMAEAGTSIRKNINRLVRVRVSCMNPNKREWEGEIISVGSAKVGTFKKFVPFNNEEGYHIPYIIYQAMKERQYTQFSTVKGPRGEKIRKGKLVPEFNIEVMSPLTKQELQDLAQRQSMSGAID